MRLNRLHVVAITLLCLVMAGPAQAQFGKLKSLAKEKLGTQTNKEDKKPEAAASSSASENRVPEGEGEATASFAPGVQKSLDVWRRGGPTPEATTTATESGRRQEVTINVKNVDARIFDVVRGYKPCNRLENFQILSATQMRLTVDLTDDRAGGTCYLYFRSGGKTVFSAHINILGLEAAKNQRRMEAMQRESQLPWEQQVALGKKRIGKRWTVKFANGNADTWTLIGPDPESESHYRFKAADGKKLDIGYSAGVAVIRMGEDCMMQAPLDGNTAEGTAMQNCGVPFGTKFNATIE